MQCYGMLEWFWKMYYMSTVFWEDVCHSQKTKNVILFLLDHPIQRGFL
jgi:hypothetical protein